MSDLICRNTMMRCQTPGMCSPHGGCRETEPVSSVWLERLRSEFRTAVRERDALKAECEGLRKDAERYRFVSQLAWYVDQAAYVYDIGNQKATWSDQREAVDADQVEDAIDAVMGEGGQSNG